MAAVRIIATVPDKRLSSVSEEAPPLRVLYLDLNSYFASVEQQEDPRLRGKPVAVGPVSADTGTIIAASYEAKKFGIKTGTLVGEAKRLCPDVIFVGGHHTLYSYYHNLVLEAVDRVLPVERVWSIDEMHFRLIGNERDGSNAIKLAKEIKQALRDHVGECITCSIGIAPNSFLAKLATDLQKPDGLVVIRGEELPDRLRGLNVKEFAGINRRMEARLQAAGIFSSDDMIDASAIELRGAFGSLVGERWWHLLRGADLTFEQRTRQSLGHSHVLPPEFRTDEGARDVLLRLTTKACARLRASNLWARSMSIHVKGRKRHWESRIALPPTQDTIAVTQEVLELWAHRDFDTPIRVGITFGDVAEREEVTPSLFDDSFDRTELNAAVDRMNGKFGKNSIYLAGLHNAKDTAHERIAFQKTDLFSEGKDDNIWKEPPG